MKDQFQWGIKLQCNPLAHQNTPADYIVSYQKTSLVNDKLHLKPQNKFILVEAKQVTCKNKSGRLNFKRLKQRYDLLAFDTIHEANSAFFLIGYYDNGWRDSEVYLVPIKTMEDVIAKHNKVSLNRTDAKKLLKDYLLELKAGGVLQCMSLLKSIS